MLYVYIYMLYIYRVFTTWGNGRRAPPPTSLKFAHRPNLKKFSPRRLPRL